MHTRRWQESLTDHRLELDWEALEIVADSRRVSGRPTTSDLNREEIAKESRPGIRDNSFEVFGN